ncbi:MAG: carboxypeptidase-like regulatory domain-containing protein [Gemmatimonadetes bacterium]|nr:carboxypeptidase-like regulatory domain-containing protein [Gemmatimonadota bacterium]
MNRTGSTITTLVLFLAAGCSSDGPVAPPEDATIQGRILDANTRESISAATVLIEPGSVSVTTGVDGRFAFALQAPRQETFTLTVEKSGYSRVQVALPPSTPSTSLEIELPPFDRIEQPDHGFRVWAQVVDGGLEQPTITWRVEVENREATTLRPVSITGRIDPFPGRLTEDSFELHQEISGEIDLEIGEDGRSFTATFDFVPPMFPSIEILDLTIVSPGPDTIICHLVEATAGMNGTNLEHDDSSCLATPVAG